MQQMPEEGKLFTQVDKYWKEIMRNTVKDPKVSMSPCTIVLCRATYACMPVEKNYLHNSSSVYLF